MKRLCVLTLCLAFGPVFANAQNAPSPRPGAQVPTGGRGPAGSGAPQGPVPTFADIDYAAPEPATSKGHKLDLYIPTGATTPLPVVIWTAGSAWMADTGKNGAGRLAGQLNPAGYAVAGVSIRSSSQVTFPGQLHDIKAAIRWLRANAAKYNLDPNHIAAWGASAGGHLASMLGTSGDVADLEGDGSLELYVAADDQHQLNRYTFSNGTFKKETIGTIDPSTLTFNITAGKF